MANELYTGQNEIESKSSKVQNLHELVELASERLGNSVIIEAANFDLIAYSAHYREVDAARRETILSKRVPYYIIERLKKAGIINLLETTRTPIRFPCIEDLGFLQRVGVAIYEQDRMLGIIWVQETNRVLDEEDFDYLMEISKDAAKLIVLSTESRVNDLEAKNQLLRKIIKGDFTNEQLVKIELEMLGISIPSLYTVAVVSSDFDSTKEKIKSLVQIFCTHVSKVTYWIEGDGKLIFIVGSPSLIDGSSIQLARKLMDKVMENLNQSFRTRIYVGIGREKTEIKQARYSYIEALEVVDLSKKLSRHNLKLPQEYQALGIYRLLSLIQDKNRNDGYVNDHIVKIARHDIEHDSELIPTLEAYLRNNCKAKETAKDLHIHINTLNYRINRICGITRLNLGDFQERVSTYIDLLIYRLG